MLDPVAWLLTYVLIGALIWMLCEPASFADFAVSRYCQRHGRLPPRGFMVLAVAAFIVLWPKVVVMMLSRPRT